MILNDLYNSSLGFRVTFLEEVRNEPGVFSNFAKVKSNPETQTPPKINSKTQASYIVKLDIESIVSLIGGYVLWLLFGGG